MKEPIKYNYNVITIVFDGSEVDKEFLYSGELIYYHTGSITLNVKLNSPSEDAIPIFVKEQITAPFSRLYFTPSGAGTVTLYFANPKEIKIESRLVNVDIISQLLRDDAFRYYTDQQKAFIGGHCWTPAASNYGLIELFNPTGSGKTLYVTKIRPVAQISSPIYVNKVTTQLTSPTAIAKTNKAFLGSPAASIANLQRKDDTTLPTFTNFFYFNQWNAATYYGIPVVLEGALLDQVISLAEGYGIRIANSVVAVMHGGFFEWIEV